VLIVRSLRCIDSVSFMGYFCRDGELAGTGKDDPSLPSQNELVLRCNTKRPVLEASWIGRCQ